MPAADPEVAVADAGFAPRPTCYRCYRPAACCLCARLPLVDNRCLITVLQHPRERFHPFGTARFVRLGLKRAVVQVAGDWRRHLTTVVDLTPGTAVLFPHAAAKPLSEWVEPPRQLLVLDGTWAHARSLWRLNPWLAALPSCSLAPADPSRYRIRREPAPHCLSTIEAVVAALRLIEPETSGLDQLLAAFESMVDEQIALQTADTRRRRPNRRERRP